MIRRIQVTLQVSSQNANANDVVWPGNFSLDSLDSLTSIPLSVSILLKMADFLVQSFLETVKEQVQSRARMIGGAKDELERLEKDARLLHSFLDDADIREAVRSSGLDLERQIKELVYETRDIRELLLIHRAAVTAAKRNIWLRYLTLPGIGTVYRLARKVSSTRDGKVDPLFRRIEAYRDLQGLRKHKQPTKVKQVPSVQLNSEFPPIQLEKIVGFKEHAESLISCLIQETEELDAISITGMPGIGKTTLARKIYQDETIRTEFPTRIWVDLPLSFNTTDLYLNILIQFLKQGMVSYDALVIWFDMPQEPYNSNDICVQILYEFIESGRINDHQLVYAIHACLKNSRFLLVMDDVWTTNILDCIRPFLPKRGKVLITSRNSRVTPKSHELCFLNEKGSWELLQLEVFGKLDDCPDALKPVGECIARGCDGLPLAISVVASSLVVPSPTDAADDLTENSWIKVSKNVTTYITEYGAQHNVFERVELSYARLPQFMQNCFLYLGVFPEGHEIRVWTLIRLWIAEGLVQDSWGLTLEETAERYLYDLISKNLVLVGKIYPNGLIKTCRVHKVIYGFCKYKAVDQEFYHEIKLSRGGALDSPVSFNSNHRRLCINSCLSEFLQSKPQAPCVRSVLCLNEETEVLNPIYSSTIHRSFKLLKILECKGVMFPKFPKMLSKLMNLRYITLSCDHLDVVPETIASLIYLETLVVDTQSASFKLKANIWRMKQLRHLVTKATIVLSIRGNGEAGSNLQTLTRLAPTCCTEDVLGRTPNLKTLGIRGKLSTLSEANSVSVRRLERLENLKLMNEAAADTQWRPDCFPRNLKRLTLSGTHLRWEFMSVLGKIESLEILKLKNNAFVGGSWTSTRAHGFARLGFLMIATADIVSWEASDDSFPSLRGLMIKKCEKLQKIPSTLAKSLDTLEVKDVPESAMDSAMEIEHDIARRQGQSRGYF